jgi:hypothetical protein
MMQITYRNDCILLLEPHPDNDEHRDDGKTGQFIIATQRSHHNHTTSRKSEGRSLLLQEDFYVMNLETNRPILPNQIIPAIPIDTEYFHGHMILFIRKPDVDDDTTDDHPNHSDHHDDGGTTSDDDDTVRVVQYLRHYQPRFEFQLQIQ